MIIANLNIFIILTSIISTGILLVIGVTQLKKMFQKSAKQKDSEQYKTEFLALAAHYFFTPLSVVRGNLAQLADPSSSGLSETDRQKIYQTVISGTNKLLRLAQNMILVSSIDSGQMTVILTPVNVISEIERCVNDVHPEAASKKINITFNRPHAMTIEQVSLDVEKFHLAIVNVLSNSIKFTPENGTIEIKLSENNKKFILTITDSGTGISGEEMDKLFTRFHRGTSYLSMDYQGIGLGLYLTKYLIEANGGTIHIESKQNKGTAVTIELALA